MPMLRWTLLGNCGWDFPGVLFHFLELQFLLTVKRGGLYSLWINMSVIRVVAFGFVLLMSAKGIAEAASVNASASGAPVPADCLHCICIVESGCKMPSPVCRMDVGSLSCGPYQIKEAYWKDARLKGGDLDGDWKVCTATFDCSERAVQGYMERYAISSRLGHTPTCEDFARIHNGGPNGFKNPNTIGYWLKVKKCLDG